MKAAIVCDSIIERDHAIEVLELFCELFPDASLFTFSHQPEKILGPLQRKSIKSTFLSRMAKTPQEFMQKAYLCAGAASSLELPKDLKVVVTLSEGFAHGVYHENFGKLPKNERPLHFCYLYSWLPHNLEKNLLKKVFSAHIRKWCQDALEDIDELFVSSENLAMKLDVQGTILPPPFKVNEYNLMPDGENLELDFYVVDALGMDNNQLKDLISVFDELKTKAKFINRSEKRFDELRTESEYVEFLGSACAGELAPLFNNARAYLNFSSSSFPQLAIAAMACGTPFILMDNELNREYLEAELGFFIPNFNPISLIDALKTMDQKYTEFDRKVLYRKSLKFTEGKFKLKFDKRLKEKLNPYIRSN